MLVRKQEKLKHLHDNEELKIRPAQFQDICTNDWAVENDKYIMSDVLWGNRIL